MSISLDIYTLSDTCITVTDDEILRQMGVNSELVSMFDSIDMMNRLNTDTNRVSKDSKFIWKAIT